jgi:tRNA pseudouridine55 synthase
LLLNGLMLVDKPVGISSFDVIRILRRQTGVRKIGHAGTLDPLASGLMLMLFGTACKQADKLTKFDKRYRALITLGSDSSTGDGEGIKTAVSERIPTRAEIDKAISQFTGEITQTPSAYSAIKINGKEAYKRARAGEVVVMPSRTVQIRELKLVEYNYPILELEAEVSSGTYIRSLAQDIGASLGTGAYLSGLVRTRVDNYQLSEACKLDDMDANAARKVLIRLS